MSDGTENAAPPSAGALRAATPAAIRDELEEMFRRNLVGPRDGEHETFAKSEKPRERYFVGMLAPKGHEVEAATLDDGGQSAEEDHDGTHDGGAAAKDSWLPNSIGLTFTLDGATRALRIVVRWGRYELVEGDREFTHRGKTSHEGWRRIPVEGTWDCPLKEGDVGPWAACAEQPDVVVKGKARKSRGQWIVTLFLVNETEEPSRQKDEAWVFQAEFSAAAPDGAPVFVGRREDPRDVEVLDARDVAEERAMAMLYRRRFEPAVGHGCSAHVETDPRDRSKVVRVATATLPRAETAAVTPVTAADVPALGAAVFDMQVLGATADGDLAAALTPLADAYAAWIDAEQRRIDDPASGLTPHREAAQKALERCRRAASRLREGISVLATNPLAAEAFRFANRAMHRQRVRTLVGEEFRRTGKRPDEAILDVPRQRTWYPFQLAFLLLNVPASTDLHHPERSDPDQAVADLLWFPTGGGKTEAYLGVAAYVMALRRLMGTVEGYDGEHGVAVLMRYTLRLLTVQQFQRAAALLCACEVLRNDAAARGDARYGREPFRLGLWVGGKTTPNTTEKAVGAVEGGWNAKEASAPDLLKSCPWCGSELSCPRDYLVEAPPAGRWRTFVYCSDPLGKCPFTRARSSDEGIPVLVVDDEIYRRPPTLLIATVDKFAQLPWNGETQILFGRAQSRCTRHGLKTADTDCASTHPKTAALPNAEERPVRKIRPPDLIIQDELHLISGPLGTLVGLYEIAVDNLCEWTVGGRTVRPRVIASTATIRRADAQVNALFGRQVAVFPPHGLDVEDNFFARERAADVVPGRRYVGVCTVGKRVKAAQIRVYATLLCAAERLFETYGALADPWMTLVGYFNALRELGSMRRMLDDDVTSRLSRGDDIGLAKRRKPFAEELTSRCSADKIPEVLARLERTFNESTHRRSGPKVPTDPASQPYDVVLATNMLSVGVDVKRLGLMVVAGQPKTTSEYIQATSRVGRAAPGLVVAVYNWARPRDLSHYEHFEHDHATYYRRVEALSVTPFSARALDRGLSGVLVALIRLRTGAFNGNGGAEAIRRDAPEVVAAMDAIVARAVRAGGGETAVAEAVRAALKARLDHWLARISRLSEGVRLAYKARTGEQKELLERATAGPRRLFTCLNSLRDVEPAAALRLVDCGVEEEEAR